MHGHDLYLPEAFRFLLGHLDDAHGNRKFMHLRASRAHLPKIFLLRVVQPRRIQFHDSSVDLEFARAAIAACPKLIPPSFGGTARFVQISKPSGSRKFLRSLKSISFWKTPPEST